MPAEPPPPTRLRFGAFEADPGMGELWKNGVRIKLQELPFRLLLLLLRRPGEMISREELQQQLWSGTEFGEFEQGLNTAVRKVRQALGDSAERPVFVETVQRKGYRFIAPVHTAAGDPPPQAPVSEAPPLPLARRHRPRWVLPAAAAGTCVVILGLALWAFLLRGGGALGHRIDFGPPTPLTAYRGHEIAPSFSPDGTRVAFSWSGESDSQFDIYVKAVGSENLTRLTTQAGRNFGASWSPDGKTIAFRRLLDDRRMAILLVPAEGGPEVKLGETVRVVPATNWYNPAPAWSPDGKWLAITDVAPEDAGQSKARPGLQLLSVVTGERRRLTTVPPDSLADISPVFSHDGRALAFLRAGNARKRLYILPLDREYRPAGEPRALARGFSGGGAIDSAAWMPGDQEIIAARSHFAVNDRPGLWRLDPNDGSEPVLLENALDIGNSLAVSNQGAIAYAADREDANIWSVSLDSAHKPAGKARVFIASTRNDDQPQFSPDGRNLVFVSRRAGGEDLWTCKADGSDPRQLTHMGSAGGPSWSPDGSRIVFDSLTDGQHEVYSILASGGEPRRLTNPASGGGSGVPSYSHDGKYIYFRSLRSGSEQVWRMTAEGGNPAQITRHGGHLPRESPDGKTIYYFKRGDLWQVPSKGGEETQVIANIRGFLNYAVTRDGIYYVPREDESGGKRPYSIRLYRFASRTSELVTEIGGLPPFGGFTLSPDGANLLWAQMDDFGSDLMLLKPR